MKLFDKYRLEQADDNEKSAMTELLIKQKFDRKLREQMSQRLANEYDIKREPDGEAKIRRLRIIRLGMSIAAAIVLGVLAWQIMNTNTTSYQELTQEYLALQYANDEVRKELTDLSEQRGKAVEAYNNKDFAASAAFREMVVQSKEATEQDFFYLGLSYLYQGPDEAEKAVKAFRRAMTFPQRTLYQEAEWYLTLAYLRADATEEAAALLQKRIAEQEWNADKAQKLLQLLNKNQ